MKKLAVILMFVLIACMSCIALPSVDAVTTQGIYAKDIEELTAGNFDYPAVSHIRGDFYAVAYQGADDDGFLTIIEANDNGYIINSSVDTWEFDTGYAKNINLINLDPSTGLSVIGYDRASNHIAFKTFRIYQNGTIIVDDAYDIGDSSRLLIGVDILKTSSSTFLSASANNFNENGRLYTIGFSVSPIGTITAQSSENRYACTDEMWNTAAVDNLNLIRHGTTCIVFNKGLDGTIRKYTDVCTTSSFDSGRHTYTCTSAGDASSAFLAGETHNFVAEYNEDNGLIYTSYGELADQYPTINIFNASNYASLYHERLNTDTANYNTMDVIGQNNALMTYNDGTYLLMESFVIADNGTATSQYTKTLTNDASRSDFSVFDYDVATATTKIIGAYETSSGDVLVGGVGTVPPPEPGDTQLILKDERTLETYDMTNQTLTFYAHCIDNQDYQEDITTSTTNIPVDCNYTSFEIKVEYEISDVNYAYSRYYLRDIEDTYNQFTLDSYLVNPFDTDFVNNEVVVDDLTDAYDNPRLYFDKNINGNDTQITASYLDLTNSMRAILMNGERYYVYLEADNYGKSLLGTYLAPPAGTLTTTTTLHLYDISLIPTVNKLIDLVNYQVYADDDHQVSYLVESENEANLINTTLTISNETATLYTTTSGGAYDPNNLYEEFSAGNINLSAHENDTVTAVLHFYFLNEDGVIAQKLYKPTLWRDDRIDLPLMGYVSQGFMDWFLIVMLSIVAIFATIQTADVVALALIGLAGLFVMFGWFSVGSGALALASLIAFINFISKGAGGSL